MRLILHPPAHAVRKSAMRADKRNMTSILEAYRQEFVQQPFNRGLRSIDIETDDMETCLQEETV